MLSGDLVLTAHHIVSDVNAISVRDGDGTARQARVAWQDPEADVALLQIPDTSAAALPSAPLARDWSLGDQPVHEAIALGYPRFAQRPEGEAAAELTQVWGQVPSLSGARSATLEFVVAAPPSPAQGPDSPWTGISGAALWVGSTIVGVINRGDTDPARLYAARVDRLFANPDFSRLVGSPSQDPSSGDEGVLFGRLSQPAREAVGRADGLRLAQEQDRIHMEHLLFALFEEQGSPTHQLLQDQGIDERELRRLVANATGQELPVDYEDTPPTAFPRLSRHAQAALDAAVQAAGPDATSPIRSRHLLLGALAVTECDLIKKLAERQVTADAIQLDGPPVVPFVPSFPGFAGDLPSTTDHLDFKEDVEGFARLLAAKKVTPPVSVGLFGDWGTGKSTFMGLLRRRIRQIAAQAAKAEELRGADASTPEPDFCSNIRQITFNAWHYVDVNLWASLVTRIFEGLAEPEEDDPKATKEQRAKQREQREQQQREILKQLETAQELQQEAERRADDAKRQLDRAQDALEELQTSRSEKEQELQELGTEIAAPPDLTDLLAGVEGTVAAAGLKVPTTIEDLQRLSGNLRLLGDRAELAWREARKDPKTRKILNLSAALAVLLLLTGLGLLVAGLLPGLAVFVASVVPLVASWIGTVGKVFRRVDAATVQVEQALQAAEQRRLQAAREQAERRAAAEVQLRTEIQRLGQEESRQRAEAARARQQQDAAARELEEIQAGRRLFRYIADRARGAEYRRYLGVIALIRRDFARLSELLEEADSQAREPSHQPEQEGAQNASLPRIDRIILYIDDLDRCPTDRVVEVLAAVHLILALPLFVVVVGVDSRWLLTSLQRHYRAQLESRDGQPTPPDEAGRAPAPLAGPKDEEWESTPQNYLEKIFQIPFAIRPMDGTGFRRLLGELVTVEEEGGTTDRGRGVAVTNVGPIPPPDTPEQPAPGEGNHADGDGPEEPDAKPPPKPAPKPAPGDRHAHEADLGDLVSMNPEGLQVKARELDFMAGLAELVQTPRAAKRLMNTYRLIRAGLDEGELKTFVRDKGASGSYQVVLVLLATLIGFPELARPLFDVLLASNATSWTDFLGEARGKLSRRTAAPGPRPDEGATPEHSSDEHAVDPQGDGIAPETALLDALAKAAPPAPLEVYQSWARRVVRYSFQTVRLAAESAP
jgi:hypothetical protein